jgi:N6-adenosine-specific RNA methylase IME4
MSIEAISAVPVPAHTMPNAVLFLWVPAPLLMDQPGPREVIEAWGFQAKTGRVWDKVHGMPSHYAQQITHEHLLICTRGDGMPDAPTPHDDSIFRSRATGVHSEKPNGDVLRWIQKHWTIGPRLYLFASEPHPGWECFGNDARLWPDEAREPQVSGTPK